MQFLAFAAHDVVDHRVKLIGSQAGEARHSAFAAGDGDRDLFRAHAIRNADERRKLRRRTGLIVTVADAALALVDSATVGFITGVFGQRCRPSHFVRIQIENSGGGIGCGPAPLGAAIEAGKYYGF